MNTKDRTILFIRIGLAVVFLANALTAVFNPKEFAEIIEQSFIGIIFPTAIALKIIAVNDSVMSLLVLFGKKWQHLIFGWAVIWIAVVMIALGKSLNVLEESGVLCMALALLLNTVQDRKSNRAQSPA